MEYLWPVNDGLTITDQSDIQQWGLSELPDIQSRILSSHSMEMALFGKRWLI